jgi:hypothetical protein
METHDEWWSKIERRYNEMDPELRGFYSAMLETVLWNHPDDEAVSWHKLPIARDYLSNEFTVLSGAKVLPFDVEDLRVVFEYLDQEGAIWWVKPRLDGRIIELGVSTSENDAGRAPEFEGGYRFDVNEWSEVLR